MKYRIIVVVGLPCSGKSFLSNTFKDYTILDDYYCNYYTAQLNELINKNTKLSINDPRLCNKSRFVSVVKEIKKVLNDKEILYIFFENNKEQCLINSEKRIDNKQGIKEYIEQMSTCYNVDELITFVGAAKYVIQSVYDSCSK